MKNVGELFTRGFILLILTSVLFGLFYVLYIFLGELGFWKSITVVFLIILCAILRTLGNLHTTLSGAWNEWQQLREAEEKRQQDAAVNQETVK